MVGSKQLQLKNVPALLDTLASLANRALPDTPGDDDDGDVDGDDDDDDGGDGTCPLGYLGLSCQSCAPGYTRCRANDGN